MQDADISSVSNPKIHQAAANTVLKQVKEAESLLSALCLQGLLSKRKEIRFTYTPR